MYSMVLLVAMTTSPESASCCHGFCCSAGYGGWGGCYGGYGYGCYGYGYGGYGWGYGGYGYGYAPWYSYGYAPGYYGGTNYMGGWGGYYSNNGYGPQSTPAVPAVTASEKPTKSSAYITVNTPPGAVVSIGGVTMTSPSGVLVFSSPEIPSGNTYYYKVQVEVVREGKTYAKTESVAVKAGLSSKVTLTPSPNLEVASK